MLSTGNFLLYLVFMNVQAAAAIAYANPESRRSRFRLRYGLCVLLSAAFSFLTRGVWDRPLQFLATTAMFLLTIAWYRFCCKDRPLRSAYNIFSGFLIRLAASSLANFPLYLFPEATMGMGTGANWLLIPFTHLLCGVLLLLLLDAFMIREIRNNRDFVPGFSQFLVMMLLVSSLLAYLGYTKNSVSQPVFFAIRGGFCLLMLTVFYQAWKQACVLAQHALEKRIDEEKLRYYTDLGDVIQAMNIKAHDLRHQIRALEAGSIVTDSVITDLEGAVTNYEDYIQTGNPTVDVLLTDAALRCKREEIDADFRVDGTCLSFMEASDLNALFGNAVDNAIEYLKTLPEEDRLFWVSGGRTGDFIRLRFENRLTGLVQISESGTPKTTKPDTLSHGYGTQSILTIARKYGGHAVFTSEDGVFTVCVILPVKPS